MFSLKTASYPLLASAVLHLTAFFPLGFVTLAGLMFAIGILYIPIAYGLQRALRWLAYITFIFMLVGMIGAYANTGSASALANLWFWAITAADFLTAIILIAVLWRPGPATA